MTYTEIEKYLSEDGTPSENGAPSEDRYLSEDGTPSDGETPSEDRNPSGDGNPSEDGTPSEDGHPSEDGTPSGDETPSEDGTLPEDRNPSGDETPAEGETPTEDGHPTEDEPPSGDNNLPDNKMQELLDGIDARFERDGTDVKDLTESIRSLVEQMRIEPYSTPGYVYTPPDIPIEGYQDWEYPVIVDFMITIVGYGEPLKQSNDYDNSDQLLEDFQAFAFECYKGDVYSEFYIDKVWGADGKKLYDSQGMEEPEPEPEEPAEDLTPAILETLQSLDAHLETVEERLDGIATVSGNTLEYYDDTLLLYKEQNELLTHTLALNMAILFLLVVSFGHKVAHAFWQRMRVG